jgi:hypothetical protein
MWSFRAREVLEMRTLAILLALFLLAGCAIYPAGPYGGYGGYYDSPYYGPPAGYYYYGYYGYGPGYYVPGHFHGHHEGRGGGRHEHH